MRATLQLLVAATHLLVATRAHYLNAWAVRIRGGRQVADQLAYELGYANVGPLRGLKDTYLLRKMDQPERSRRSARTFTRRLDRGLQDGKELFSQIGDSSTDGKVVWAEQQMVRPREKRGLAQGLGDAALQRPTVEPPVVHPRHAFLRRNFPSWIIESPRCGTWASPGRGIVVTVMDDGLEWNHTDLTQNYAPEASYDFNDDDRDPFPRYDPQDLNNHGTRCAGEIAMTANNRNCGVGVAYEARIRSVNRETTDLAGIRMLDGDVVDAVESTSLAFNVEAIDVFSASWGPSDDGRTVDGPKRLASEALERGVTRGRGGRGSVYVWASGNGGAKGGQLQLRRLRGFPVHPVRCPAPASAAGSLTTARSAPRPWRPPTRRAPTPTRRCPPPDLHDSCTTQHTGTSASAPLAAGIVALVLQANPDLGWRDVQHLVAWTSDFAPLSSNRGWKRKCCRPALQQPLRVRTHGRACHGTGRPELDQRGASRTVPTRAVGTAAAPAGLSPATAAGLRRQPVPTGGARTRPSAPGPAVLAEGSPGRLPAVAGRHRKRASLPPSQGHHGPRIPQLDLPHGPPVGRRPARGLWVLVIRDKDNVGRLNAVSMTLSGTREQPAYQVMNDGRRRYDDEQLAHDVIDTVPEYEEEEEAHRAAVIQRSRLQQVLLGENLIAPN
ncbi:hypothetical protein MRX96_033375 [Rhipicephalus microplus]